MPSRKPFPKYISFWRILIPKSRKAWIILLGSSFTLYLLVWFALPFAFPYQSQALVGEKPSLLILDRNGDILHHKSRDDYFRLLTTELNEVPDDLIKATTAAEDKRFYDHSGVDLLANLRAIKDSISAGRMVSGASTITQQTIKLSTPKKQRPARNFKTKIIEAFTARHLELTTDKQTILASYFNHLDYGNHMLGPKQASLHYFGRTLDQLSLSECALLAGIPQSPSRHNPRKNLTSAKNRRDWILDRMQIVHGVDADRIQRAKKEPITLSPARYQTNAPQIATYVEKYHSLPPSQSTFQTTIEPSMQLYAQQKLSTELNKLKDKNVNNGAVVVINNSTREIIALVGSKDFHSSESGQINAALVPRSPGSALKPLAYILAFEELGMQPSTIVPDIKTVYGAALGTDEYVNYSRNHSGPVSIFHALGNSLNIPIVRITNQMGGAYKLLKLYQKIGFTNLTEPAKNYGLSLAIGSGEVSLLDATNAFATISRQGLHRSASMLLSRTNENITGPDHQPLFTKESAFLVTSILNSNPARSHAFGTRSHLRLPFPCAVKTGTSTDFRDNWCIGFTKEYTVGIWVGNLNNSPMRGISGVTGAGPIFKSIMLELHKHQPPTWYEKPDSIQAVSIDQHTGKQLLPTHPRYTLAIQTYSLKSDLPELADDSHYDHQGRIYLDNTYSTWLKNHPHQSQTFASNQLQLATRNLRIISPTHGSTFLLDPDLPNQGKFLTLKSSSSNQTKWKSETLQIIHRNNQHSATLIPGKHKITVIDGYTKEQETIDFTVKRQ